MNTVFIIFPIVFMLHELEEIIWMPDFSKKILSSKKEFPKIVSSYLGSIDSKKFSFIVMEEFFLLGLATVLCYFYSQYNIYIAIIIGYGIHVIGHGAQSLYLKKYVPGLLTGIISIIIMFILIKNILVEVDVKLVLIQIIPITILIFLNLFICHRYVKL